MSKLTDQQVYLMIAGQVLNISERLAYHLATQPTTEWFTFQIMEKMTLGSVTSAKERS